MAYKVAQNIQQESVPTATLKMVTSFDHYGRAEVTSVVSKRFYVI